MIDIHSLWISENIGFGKETLTKDSNSRSTELCTEKRVQTKPDVIRSYMQSPVFIYKRCPQMPASLERTCNDLIDARAHLRTNILNILRRYILTIFTVSVLLERHTFGERNLCAHHKHVTYSKGTKRTLFRVNKWRTCHIFIRQMHEYIIRNVSLAAASQWYSFGVLVYNRTETANTRLKTKRLISSHTFLKHLIKIIQCSRCVYDRLVSDSLKDVHSYMKFIRLIMLAYVMYIRCVYTCICFLYITFLFLQLIILKLLRLRQRKNANTAFDMDIPEMVSLESLSRRGIQNLYSCNEQGSFTKLYAGKPLTLNAGKEDPCKTEIDDRFEEKRGQTANDIIARLRKNVWLPTTEFLQGLSISVWLSPVLSPVINIINRLAEGRSVPPKESMRHELLRLCTFRTYPTHGKPSCIRLAKAGFYYASQGDEVICYCCAKRISNWNQRDEPMRAHRLVSPSCPFLIRNSEVNEPVTNDTNESSNARLNRILQSLDDSDDQTETGPDNSPAESAEAEPLSTTSRSNTTEPASYPQNGACGYADEATTSRSTHELPVTARQTAGVSQYTSLPVQRARSSIPAGCFACSSAAEAPVTVPNAGREKAPPQEAASTVQSVSSRRSDDVREKLLSENRALKAQTKCLRCRRNDVCIAFLPCGHLVSCEACSTDPSARKCFSCDAFVKARIKAFIA